MCAGGDIQAQLLDRVHNVRGYICRSTFLQHPISSACCLCPSSFPPHRNERLALPRAHLCNLPLMQDHAADELGIKRAQPQHTLGGLARNLGKGGAREEGAETWGKREVLTEDCAQWNGLPYHAEG